MKRVVLDPQPTAPPITIADLAGWLVGALAFLVSIVGWFLRQLYQRFEAHIAESCERDDEIEALKLAQARTEERHDALVGTVERIERKVNALPAEIVALLARGRS